MGFLLQIFLNLSIFLCVLICAASLSSFLFYLAEFAEEYHVLVRRILHYGSLCGIGIHVLFLLVDDLPVVNVLVGLMAHIVYCTMLRTFPFVSLASMEFIGSCVMIVVDHVNWFYYFSANRSPSLLNIVAFYLIFVWIIPFSFLVTVSVEEIPFSNANGDQKLASSSFFNLKKFFRMFRFKSVPESTLLPTSRVTDPDDDESEPIIPAHDVSQSNLFTTLTPRISHVGANPSTCEVAQMSTLMKTSSQKSLHQYQQIDEPTRAASLYVQSAILSRSLPSGSDENMRRSSIRKSD